MRRYWMVSGCDVQEVPSKNESLGMHNSSEFSCMEQNDQSACGIEKRGRNEPPGMGEKCE